MAFTLENLKKTKQYIAYFNIKNTKLIIFSIIFFRRWQWLGLVGDVSKRDAGMIIVGLKFHLVLHD
jgi:hypothetical protein